MRNIKYWLLGLVLIIFFLFFNRSVLSPTILPVTEIRIGETKIMAEVADDQDERAMGLSGRKFLTAGQGMVFLFDGSEQRGFWMKDMNFPLDIIWINDGIIVEISRYVMPPEAGKEPVPFYSKHAVSAVLEVPAGYAEAQGWELGDEVLIKT